MEAKDLRIGNLISYTNSAFGSGKGKVFAIQEKLIIVDHVAVYPTEIEPIPLTEEWLVKFGFIMDGEKGEYGKVYTIDNIRYCIDLQVWNNKEIHFVTNRGCTVSKIKHVHQLQNLFHALTGEELTIKE